VTTSSCLICAAAVSSRPSSYKHHSCPAHAVLRHTDYGYRVYKLPLCGVEHCHFTCNDNVQLILLVKVYPLILLACGMQFCVRCLAGCLAFWHTANGLLRVNSSDSCARCQFNSLSWYLTCAIVLAADHLAVGTQRRVAVACKFMNCGQLLVLHGALFGVNEGDGLAVLKALSDLCRSAPTDQLSFMFHVCRSLPVVVYCF